MAKDKNKKEQQAEEPVMEPSWPHLQLAYDIFL